MKKVALLMFFVVIILNVQGQDYSDATFKESFNDGEFFLAAEEYIDALTFYKNLHSRGFENNANINYRMGICYLNIPDAKSKAIPHFEKAILKADDSYKEGTFKQDKAPLDAYIFLGNAYRINNQLDKAIDTYKKYKTLLDEKKELEKKFADQQIIACNNAKKMMQTPINVEITNLGTPINSSSSNYNPTISGNGNTMIYMFELPFYDAIYMSVNENGVWGRPKNITPEVLSDGDLFTQFLSIDGKTLLLSKESAFNSDIWKSELDENGKWSAAQPLSKDINSKFWESHASLSADGKKLFFTSNRSNGYGEMDIYISEKNDAGLWKEPHNIGSSINSELNEDCPILTPDGKHLFFSSQGHNTMGGYDLFYSELKDDGNWSKPVNIGYPLNTTDDEVFFYPTSRYSGFISRLGDDSRGKTDIYAVNIKPPTVEPVNEIAEVKEEPIEKVVIEKDTTTLAIADNVIEEQVEEIIEESSPVTEEVIEEKLEVKTIDVKHIYFAFDNTNLPETEQAKLTDVIFLLKENKNISIELQGYADALGDESYNKSLSLLRAKSVKKYLVNNGIEASRITTKGLGKSKFIAINNNSDGTDNKEGRHYNRRVEVQLSNFGDYIIINSISSVPEKLKIK